MTFRCTNYDDKNCTIVKNLENALSHYQTMYEVQHGRKKELEKENAELKEKYKALSLNTETRIKGCNDEIYRLKAQIEKMKCCGNCKYYSLNDEDYDDVDENPCNDCYGFSKWELAE